MKRLVVVIAVLATGCGDVVKKAEIDAPPGGGDGGVDAVGDASPDSNIDAPPAVAPVITGITPTWGSSAGGTAMKITGTGLNGSGLVVNVGTGTATNVMVISATELRVVTPPGPNAPVSVKVTNDAGTSTAATQFRMYAPLYAADGRGVSGNLYAVNPATGASTSVGAIGAPITGLAWSPAGVLYGVTTTAMAQRLVTINPYTGASSVVGDLKTTAGVFTCPHDITFEGNRLIGWKGTSMVEVNALSGQVQVYTASVGGGGCGIASRGSGTMYFTPKSGNMPFYTVNTATGAAATSSTMNGPAQTINSLTFVGNTMFGSFASPKGVGQTVALYSIDTATGTTQLRGALPPNVDAIEGIPPQPPIAAVAPEDPGTGALPVTPAAVAVAPEPAPAMRTIAEVARGRARVTLVDPTGATFTVSASNTQFAIVPNHKGELKLIAPAVSTKRIFGPIVEIR